MRTRAGRLALTLLAVTFAPVVALLVLLFVYDPVAVFHEPWGRPTTVHHNMRLQAVGVIRHDPFDSVLLGTSILENTSADEASRVLGGHFVNLSVTAGDFFERGLVLGYLLDRRPVREVVYSLDFIYLNQRVGYRLFPLPTFDYLYDGNPLNDIRVYLNTHFLGCLARWSAAPDCVGRPVTLDRPNAWMFDAEHAARFGGFDKWCRAADNYQIRDVYEKVSGAAASVAAGRNERLTAAEQRDRTARAVAYVDDYVLTHVRAHPETRFHLVFPPYSRAKFALWYQDRQGDAEAHLAVVRHLAAASALLPNLTVYGYEDQDFPDDLAHYKDIDHFDPSINSLMLQSIRDRRNAITPANVESYIADARRRALAFDLGGLAARLRACREGGPQ